METPNAPCPAVFPGSLVHPQDHIFIAFCCLEINHLLPCCLILLLLFKEFGEFRHLRNVFPARSFRDHLCHRMAFTITSNTLFRNYVKLYITLAQKTGTHRATM